MDGDAPTDLVGRGASLGTLRETLRGAEAGTPAVVLLAGETGVGKTRLVKALVDADDPIVLAGSCVPMAGEPLPFAPLTQALRKLTNHGAVRQQLARTPELARLLPGGTAGQTASGASGGETSGPATSQLGLFQGVLELLARLGAAGPVLFLVEDIHWADRSTLDLVRFLAGNLTGERVVVLATLRADGVTAGSAMAGWLAELARLPITRRLDLERLDADDTAALVAQLVGSTPSRALLDAAVRRSDGNPLYVEQLVAHGADTRGLPSTLQDLLLARVTALPPQTAQVLRAAAVLGRPAPPAMLAGVLDSTVELVEAGIRPALTQHVLSLRPDDAVAFSHPAFGEVVYGDLLPAERRRLHRGAAQALAGAPRNAAPQAGGRLAGELARHWLAAGDLPRALDAAVAAGQEADEMYAFADAHDNFARAADLTEQVVSGNGGHRRGELLLRAAQAAHHVGNVDEAVRLGELALEDAAEPRERVVISERMGAFHSLGGHREEAERYLLMALRGLPEGDRSELAARVYAGLAMVAASWSRLDEGAQWSALGLQAAESSDARREAGLLHNALGTMAVTRGDDEEGIAHLWQALTLAREAGEPDDVAYAYVNLSHSLGVAGRFDEVVEVAREGQDALTRTGLSRNIGNVLVANAAEALLKAGRTSEAAHMLDDALAHEPPGIMAAPVLLRAASLALLQGDLTLARERCEQARAMIEAESAPDAWMRVVLETAAEIELWAGRPAAAYDLVIEGLHLTAGTDEQPFGLLLSTLGMQALADQADARRDPASRARWAELRGPLDLAASQARTTQPEDAARLLWRAAEASRVDLDPRPDLWQRTAQAWSDLGQPFGEAYARWREAEARLDAGVDADAIAAVRAAHRAAQSLGARRIEEEVVRLSGWHRIDLVATEPALREASTAGTGDGLATYGLTAREIEVLEGLAHGRTNREIADGLFISVKTASVHVSNILRKLDVSGRQEAARVAHRLGLG